VRISAKGGEEVEQQLCCRRKKNPMDPRKDRPLLPGAAPDFEYSQERFRSMVQNSSDIVSLLSEDGTILFESPSIETVLGFATDELIGQNAFDYIHPDDREAVHARFVMAITEGKGIASYYRFMNAAGSWRWMESVATNKLDHPELRAMVVNSRDVTERKHTEDLLRETNQALTSMVAELRASEERFSKAFNSNPHPMSITTLDEGRFISVNERFISAIGMSREELIGKTTYDLHWWPQPESRETVLSTVRTRGWIPPIEFKLRLKSGERTISWTAQVIELAGQSCLLNSAEDITDRKRTEEEQLQLQAALQKSALEWRLTFDAVDSPMLLLDSQCRVVRLNRAARDLSGKSYWEVKGHIVYEIGPRQPWQKAAELGRLIAQSRSSYSAQIYDGEAEKTWEITGGVFSGSGVDDRIIIVARDVTPTVLLQDSLRRSETMSAMGALVAGVAHEVRNPLFSISATLDAFEARFGEKEEHRRYVGVLRTELDRLNQLMQDLLEYGRPTSLELTRRPLSDAIQQAVASCSSLAQRAQVRLDNTFSVAFSPIMMDVRRMAQVFHNLIENAIQHSKPGDTVEVAGEEFTHGGRLWIDCSIADMGPGFRDEDLPRLFEPFFTKRRGGTGLGLSIVQKIVEEHGGRIWASNRPGGGAVMKLRLKAPSNPADKVSSEANPAGPAGPTEA
jgi:PAS domain S-box-containing protein